MQFVEANKNEMRVFAFPLLRERDVTRMILYKYLSKRDRQMFRCAWFPQQGKDPSLAGYYAKRGDLHMLQWALHELNRASIQWAWEGAAKSGHLFVFEWLLTLEIESLSFWDVVVTAGRHGQVAALEWLDKHVDEIEFPEEALVAAARRGHAVVLEHGRRKRARFTQDTRQWIRASRISEVIEWARLNR